MEDGRMRGGEKDMGERRGGGEGERKTGRMGGEDGGDQLMSRISDMYIYIYIYE